MKPQKEKNKKCNLEVKYGRDNGDYHKAYRAFKKKEDPLFWKSHQLRSNWAARAKKLGVVAKLPSAGEIRDWLNKQRPFSCYYTGVEIKDSDIGLDHKIPIARGGSYDLNNIVVTSKIVNGAKGDMTDLEFKQLLKLISKWEDGGKSVLIRLRASGGMFKKGKK